MRLRLRVRVRVKTRSRIKEPPKAGLQKQVGSVGGAVDASKAGQR